MDIVIPYIADPHDGLELRYALRSIDKYLSGFGSLFIVGNAPKWLHNYKSIQGKDYTGRPQFSIKEKIIAACKDERVGDDFIMWHDDHYLLGECFGLSYWYDISLSGLASISTKGYKRVVEDTLSKFPDGLNYDVHCPIVFNKTQFVQTMYHTEEQLVKSTYCNSINAAGFYMPDCKLNFPYAYSAIRAKINDRLFFSTGVYSLNEDMIRVLNELYPEASRWEYPNPSSWTMKGVAGLK
jgi:hypothetical protein